MSGERAQLADIREARRLIESMRDRLRHPSFEALECSAADLGLAAQCIRRLDVKSRIWQGAQRKALESEVSGLRHGVHCVEALLTNAGKFYAGWARLMSGDQAPPNYSSTGSTDAAPSQTSKLAVHG